MSKEKKNSYSLYKEFLMLEDKYDLIRNKINGVYWWRLIRLSLYLRMNQSLGLWGSANSSELKNSIFNKLLYRIKYIYNGLFNSCIYGNQRKDILICEHKRKKKINGEYIDIHTNFLLDSITNDNKKIEIIDQPYNGKHLLPTNENRKYYESLRIIEKDFNKVFSKVNLTQESIKLISNIEKKIKKISNINLDLVTLVKRNIISFKSDYKFYFKYLQKKEFKKIYLVVSNVWLPLIAAAHDLGIEVIEIQHGSIHKNHLVYNFPNIDKGSVPYYPDEMILYGEYWYENADIPLKEENIIYQGNKFLKDKIKKYQNVDIIKDQIIFISQGTIGNELAKLAYDFAKNNNKYEIFFKLHPEEYSHWRKSYEVLNKAIKLSNFTLIDNYKHDFFELLAESEYQVGVYSTAIFEGLLLNCKTLLVDLPGVEMMEYLIQNSYVSLIKNSYESLENKISKANLNKIDMSYFYDDNNYIKI